MQTIQNLTVTNKEMLTMVTTMLLPVLHYSPSERDWKTQSLVCKVVGMCCHSHERDTDKF